MSLRKYILGAMNQVPRFILLCCVTLSLPIIAWAATTVGDGITITAEDLTLDNTTNANQYGIIYKGSTPFIHNFNYGDNGTVTTSGRNLFIGENAGNFTMGSTATLSLHSSSNTIIGKDGFSSDTIGNNCTGIGYNVLHANTEGARNGAFGSNALAKVTTGSDNIGIGYYSLYNNTTGTTNVGLGSYALVNDTGDGNVSLGHSSLYFNTSGNYNNGIGLRALYSITTGSSNVGIGQNAGRYIANGSTANQTSGTSIYIGEDTKANANGDANEIVIGYNTTGLGSNTVVLGNDSITTTVLKGNVGVGLTAPSAKLDVDGGIRPDQVTADPCGAGYPEGTLFYNDTSNYFCYCDGTNDVKMNDPATACF